MVFAAVLAGCGLEGEEQQAPEVSITKAALSGPMPYRGVNLASAEFGVNSDGTGSLPGTYGSTYVYPSATSADYFLRKGMTTFRLPFRWERLQRTRRAALDATELGRMRTSVTGITSRGGVVLLDPHNYARYGTAVIGSSSVPNADFADFWSRVATEFKSNPNVIFGLMNEPYDLPTEQWVSAANAAIAAIRATGATNLILVPGNAWTGAHSWTENWYGTANSVALLAIRDSGNNVAYEVHQYFDSNASGSSDSCITSSIGAAQFGTFTNWLRANGKKGFVGEFATGTSATCLADLDAALTYLDQNSDVYLGWTYWAAGPLWGSSWYSIEPSGTTDKAQMTVLARHLGAAVSTPSCTDGVRNGTETGVDCGGSCAACPVTSCQPTTWEAETMVHSTGGSATGGWTLWTNGEVQTTSSVSFPSASTLVVTARGTVASSVWPRMIVSVGSTPLGTVSVTATSWTAYRFNVPAGASGTVRVAFDNDAVSGTEDRNLYLDKVALECSTTGGTTACTGSTTYEAETMVHSTGGAATGGWNLWSNGYASTQHTFTGAPVGLVVTAKGTAAGQVWPHFNVTVGGVLVGSATVTSSTSAEYGFDVSRPAGTAEIRVAFDNDAVIGTEDRNLILDNINLRCP